FGTRQCASLNARLRGHLPVRRGGSAHAIRTPPFARHCLHIPAARPAISEHGNLGNLCDVEIPQMEEAVFRTIYSTRELTTALVVLVKGWVPGFAPFILRT